MSKPRGLGTGGSTLWGQVSEAHDLDPLQQVQLEEACRAKDRLDKLDRILRGDVATWLVISEDRDGDLSVSVDSALAQANTTANLMKQLLAALRLPDEASGKRPQQRGGARGAYSKPGKGAGKVSSLDAARARAGA